jgi:arabinofuranosyltransferase
MVLGAALLCGGLHAWQELWLCDDAFISFRYARQFVDGFGLVFNHGERVEGYTNFLWVLQIALGIKLGLAPEPVSVALGGFCSLALAALLMRVMIRSPLAQSWLPAAWALLLLALNRSFAVWTSSGLETRQFTLLCSLGLVLAASAVRRFRAVNSEAAPWWKRAECELGASLALALAEGTRPEGALVFACVVAGYTLLGPLPRWLAAKRHASTGTHATREAWLRLGAIVVPFLLLVAAHYLFRRGYYGDWLPNTYYAKHVRPWPESGDHFIKAAFIEHGVYLLLPLAVLGAFARLRRGDALYVLAFAVLVPHLLYVRRIGGDHFEYRPLDLHWPWLTVAAVDGLLALYHHPRLTRWRLSARKSALHAGQLLGAFGYLGLAEYSTLVQRAYEHEVSALTTRANTYKLRAQLTPKSTFELGWLLPAKLLRDYNVASAYCVEHQSCTRQEEHKAYWRLLEKEYGRYRTLTADEATILPKDATWAREAVGIAPYMFPGVTVIDRYGLTDRTIARTTVDTPNEQRTMAHDRKPPPGYLDARGINLELGPAAETQGQALRYAYWAVRAREDLWIPFLAYRGEWVASRFLDKPLFSRFAYDTEQVAKNLGWVDGSYSRAFQFLGRFDHAAQDGWTELATSAAATPVLGDTETSGYVGAGYLSTAHVEPHEVMHFVSPPFIARGHLVFLLAGGGSPSSELRLVVEGGIVKTWSGHGASAFELHSEALSPFEGKSARLELRDSGDASIALDHVLLVEAATAHAAHEN